MTPSTRRTILYTTLLALLLLPWWGLLRHAAATPPPLPIICIDPGHPSEVNRATTVQHGLQEVEVDYDVAVQLRDILVKNHVARVLMTRNFREGTGPIVTNRRRAEIANKAGAALLLRLHCDTGHGSGFTLYTPDRSARAHDGTVGPSHTVIAASRQAATALDKGMRDVWAGERTRLRDNGVKGESHTAIGHKQGALTGSIYSHVPAVTVEMAVLSNAADARLIGSKAGKRTMAEALERGIVDYLQTRK